MNVTPVDPTRGAVLVGLMSGTSLDGISAAAVRFVDAPDGRIESTLLSFAHRAYHADERARLEQAMHSGTAREYCRVQVDLADWLADAAQNAMDQAALSSRDIAAIASHGQTLWHEPGHSTWQIGDAARIAERTGCAVVADFRTRDVAAGGQGAPLVPAADALLFAHPSSWRALQNLGGIGNVTIVPPSSAMRSGETSLVRAFDTGPGVVILDGVVRTLYPSLSFDRDGAIAASGTPISQVIDDLLTDAYFAASPPKSTGRELYTPAFIASFIERCHAVQPSARPENVVATATYFTARSMADQFARFVPEPVADLLIAGGGAKNPTLINAIRATLRDDAQQRGHTPWQVELFDTLYFDGEAKEAVAFALLGYLHLTGRSGNVPSATGARGPRLLGHYTPAH